MNDKTQKDDIPLVVAGPKPEWVDDAYIETLIERTGDLSDTLAHHMGSIEVLTDDMQKAISAISARWDRPVNVVEVMGAAIQLLLMGSDEFASIDHAEGSDEHRQEFIINVNAISNVLLSTAVNSEKRKTAKV